MRLDETPSLSPQDLLRQARAPLPKAPPKPRVCCQCGAPDRVEHSPQLDDKGDPQVEHFVTIELRYVKNENELTRRLVGQGWHWKPPNKMHQGRLAIERLICRPCMNRHGIMEREWRSKRAAETKTTVNHDTYYQLLCEETIA